MILRGNVVSWIARHLGSTNDVTGERVKDVGQAEGGIRDVSELVEAVEVLHLANWRKAGYGDATEAGGTIEARRTSFTNTMEGPATVRPPLTPGGFISREPPFFISRS